MPRPDRLEAAAGRSRARAAPPARPAVRDAQRERRHLRPRATPEVRDPLPLTLPTLTLTLTLSLTPTLTLAPTLTLVATLTRFEAHASFAAPLRAPLAFTIRHYAGEVTYLSTGFCAKNKVTDKVRVG